MGLDLQKFALRLRALRKERRLTQGQLAKKVGIGTSQISNLELPTGKPSVDVFCALAPALGVSLDYLAGLDMTFELKPTLNIPPWIEDLIPELNSLPPSGRASVRSMIRVLNKDDDIMRPIPHVNDLKAAMADPDTVRNVNQIEVKTSTFAEFVQFYQDASPKKGDQHAVIAATGLAFTLYPDYAGMFSEDQLERLYLMLSLSMRLCALKGILESLPKDLMPNGPNLEDAPLLLLEAAVRTPVEAGWPPEFLLEGFVEIARSIYKDSETRGSGNSEFQ